MSILIKGMEMPKDCPMCPLAHWDAADNFTGCNVIGGKKYAMSDHEYANSNVRPDWCPIVNIPPHSRLVDADKLMQEMRLFIKENMLSRDDARELLETIEDAPTIIPAELTEEGK